MSRRPAFSAPNVSVLGRGRPEPFVEATITVATPLFGGGAVSRAGDADFPVRGSAVRGHLRFWWRACQAHRYASPADLFAHEAAVWGQAASGQTGAPSAVDIDVELRGTPQELTVDQWSGQCPQYAVWPFRAAEGIPAATALTGVQFHLRLSLAQHVAAPATDITEQAKAALWAWILFGGLGSRTRRGCGSLWCADPRFSPGALDGLTDRLQERAMVAAPGDPGATRPPVPCIAGSELVVGATGMTPTAAWANAVGFMQTFRQGVNVGRDPGRQNRPGESRWPEPDSIRNLTGTSMGRHLPADANLRYFPRADLGLPIVFRFKQDGPPRPDGSDPPPHILEAGLDGATRMASPIILKPLMVSATQAVPLVMLLDAPLLKELPGPGGTLPVRLRRAAGGHGAASFAIGNPGELFDAAKADAVSPLAAQGKINPRLAFMEFVRASWGGPFAEVEL